MGIFNVITGKISQGGQVGDVVDLRDLLLFTMLLGDGGDAVKTQAGIAA